MSGKEAFLKEKELKLTEVDDVLTMLQEMVSEDDQHFRGRYLRLIENLQQESRSLRTELAKLQMIGDDGWDGLRDRIEFAWNKLRTEVEAAICDFESEAN